MAIDELPQLPTSRVIWVTGLSGAGKTTIARLMIEDLKERNIPIILLDGDELRGVLGVEAASNDNHNRDARLKLAMLYGGLCKLIANQGVSVMISTISLFKEVHQWNRDNLPGYFEIFVDVPIEILQKRDPKDIYSRYQTGELKNITGVDIPADFPRNPDLHIEWDENLTAQKSAQLAIEKILNTWH